MFGLYKFCGKYRNQLSFRNGSTIKVILQQDLVNKGKNGDIVSVKRGYARNLLIPRKLALYATTENKARISSLNNENAINDKYSKFGDKLIEMSKIVNKIERVPLKESNN